MKNNDLLFVEVSKKIADSDFSGYTFQYPPLFSWKSDGAEEAVHAAWKKALSRKGDHLGIYVHIPFCKQRCTYCRYFSKKLDDRSELSGFLDSLRKEVGLLKGHFTNQKIHSLYIGGGTPSILSVTQITELFDLLHENFDFSECVQAVFEGNPDFLTLEKLRRLKRHGVNRLTIGVQSLDQKVIDLVNRFQTTGSFQKCIKNAKKVGIETINIDLMIGLPGQSGDSFIRTLREVMRLDPDMVHLHPFYPTHLTAFSKSNRNFTEKEIGRREKMSEIGHLMLKQSGYLENEFDAASKEKKDINIQLSDAMEFNSSFLGLGPGAVSHVAGSLRYVNMNTVNGYKRSLDEGRLPLLSARELRAKDDMVYHVISCLRYGGVDKERFRRLFGQEADEVFAEEIAFLVNRKKIENTTDALLPKFSDLGEYTIFSKYFYDEAFIADCEKAFPMTGVKGSEELYF